MSGKLFSLREKVAAQQTDEGSLQANSLIIGYTSALIRPIGHLLPEGEGLHCKLGETLQEVWPLVNCSIEWPAVDCQSVGEPRP